jgi:hypothetical protein
MSKSNPYPTSYEDQPKEPKGYDENNDGSQGGPGSLPDPGSYNTSDVFADDAKTWQSDWSAFE